MAAIRGFLMTTFPAADAVNTAPAGIIIPQIVDGGVFVTGLILLGAGRAEVSDVYGRPRTGGVCRGVRFTERKSRLGHRQQGQSCIGDRMRSPRRVKELPAVLRVQAVQHLACLLRVLERQTPQPEERDGA